MPEWLCAAHNAETRVRFPPRSFMTDHLFTGMDARDAEFDRVNPEVFGMFRQTSMQIIESGWTSYSADAILHRMRWHQQIERGNRSYKLNNNWTSYLARRLMRTDPKTFGRFFETRTLTRKKSPV